jgi:ABC-2 type transport system ATP-binding protein
MATIAGKTILVTVANGGIGPALASEAFSRGARQVAAGTRQRPGHPGRRVAAARGPVGPAISVRELRMSYGSHEAIRGIDFEVAAGEILAFLGPNGAGKTTTVEILEGFRQRTGGEVSVLGTDPARAGSEWRARVGVVLQESKPEERLSVAECLAMYAGYYQRPLPVSRALELVGLAGQAGTRCERLSGGQLRRLDMALALVGDPELIFLDEPTTGFDPSARRAAWDVIAGLRDLGKTVFLTTHYMDEAEALADRILILAAGRIAACGTPETIGGRAAETSTIRFSLPGDLTAADLPRLPASVTVGSDGVAELSHGDPMGVLYPLAAWALEHGHPLADISVHRPSLEQIYLRLTREDS